jgi:tetratricopeptide (TPR) repeat protein
MTDYAMVLQRDLAENCNAVESRPSSSIPPEAMTLFHQGLEHFQAADPVAAVGAFSQSVLRAPGFGEAHIFLGLAHALTSNIYPAFDHLERAAELQPDSFAAHFTLAQLNFKLRIPQKGYSAARQALRCATTLEQRAMLTQLLKEERARERNGIARPWFNKPFSTPALVMVGSGLAAALVALIVHVR